MNIASISRQEEGVARYRDHQSGSNINKEENSMMTKKLAGLMLTLSCMLNTSGAIAALQTYSFDVTASDGPLSGVTTTGTFSFSDAIIPSGGGTVDQLNLLVGLDFTWNGVSYDQTTANTGSLAFDAAGNLTQTLFGTDCIAGGCNASSPENAWAFIYPNGLPWNFAYTTAATGDEVFFGVSTGVRGRTSPSNSLALRFRPAGSDWDSKT